MKGSLTLPFTLMLFQPSSALRVGFSKRLTAMLKALGLSKITSWPLMWALMRPSVSREPRVLVALYSTDRILAPGLSSPASISCLRVVPPGRLRAAGGQALGQHVCMSGCSLSAVQV